MSWTQPLCRACWDLAYPGRRPTRVIDSDLETCCVCGQPTSAGIYVRVDPATVAFPRSGKEDA